MIVTIRYTTDLPGLFIVNKHRDFAEARRFQNAVFYSEPEAFVEIWQVDGIKASLNRARAHWRRYKRSGGKLLHNGELLKGLEPSFFYSRLIRYHGKMIFPPLCSNEAKNEAMENVL